MVDSDVENKKAVPKEEISQNYVSLFSSGLSLLLCVPFFYPYFSAQQFLGDLDSGNAVRGVGLGAGLFGIVGRDYSAAGDDRNF